MYRLLLAAVVAAGLVAPAFAQNALKEDELLRIKSATVFVKLGAPRVMATGSGFLVKVDGETGYLVTNDHVIDPNFETPTPSDGPKNTTPVAVVFESGTPKEREFRATVVAADPDRDLAVLKVEKVKDLPTPLDIANPPKLFETMQVFACGFPFGSRLAEGNKNPEISIGGCAVSSIRTEVAGGPISSIQINGALNPGNSGGPVVSADGKVVGVVVRGVRGSGIGSAIPQHEVAAIMRGRIGRPLLLPAKPDADMTTDIAAKLQVSLLDPLKNVKAVTARVLPGSMPVPKTPEPPGPIADAKTVELKLSDDTATAEVTVPDKKGLIVQFELTVGEGKVFTNPLAIPVGPTAPGMIGRPPSPTDPNGPQRTPDGKLKLASGIILPLPKVPVEFPKPSGSESVSVVNAGPEPFVGKTIRMDALSGCVINPNDKNEYELTVETDTENAPSELRVVLPKDLALQVADLGIPELQTVILQVKFPVRVLGKMVKPAGKERRYTLTAEALEFLDDDGKAVTTLKPEGAAPAGKPTLAVVNRFPEKFVGQTLTFDAVVKGTRYGGGTSIDLLTLNQAAPLNLEVYTSRSLATQVDSDIAKTDLPARARVTVEVKAVNGKTQKGVVGVKQIDVLEGDKVSKSLKPTSAVEYPTIPTAAKVAPAPTPKAAETKSEEKMEPAPPAAKTGGDSTMLIVALAAAVVLVLGGGFVLMMAMRKSKAVDTADDGEAEEEPAPRPKPAPKKQSTTRTVVQKPAEPAPRAKPKPGAGKAPPPADDNPFANFE